MVNNIKTVLAVVDRERRQRIRFQEMAGDDPDAQKLLLELDKLPNFGTDDDDH